jgi:hypothetical protein
MIRCYKIRALCEVRKSGGCIFMRIYFNPCPPAMVLADELFCLQKGRDVYEE